MNLIGVAERLDAVLLDLHFLVEEIEALIDEVEEERGIIAGQKARSESKTRRGVAI